MTRQAVGTDDTETPERPQGVVVWAHATSDTRFSALLDIGNRLKAQRPDVYFLISVEKEASQQTAGPSGGCDPIVAFQSDHPSSAWNFLAHWKPDLCLWTGGKLMPNLIGLAADQGIAMVMIDVGEAEFPSRRRWLPDATRNSLGRFDRILTTGPEAAAILRRIGVRENRIAVAGRLRDSVAPPECAEADFSDLSAKLAGRPVWLATQLGEDEYRMVLSAHKSALRLVHRLLLVIHVTDPDHHTRLLGAVADTKLRSALWDIGMGIEDNTQTIFSEGSVDPGLWYRVAPLTFMGNSMYQGMSGSNPMIAAALGSAVLFGPHVSDHIEAYARLASAGAARTVQDAEELGNAVVQLIAPDQAAAMALAGWEVVTEGAHLTDSVLDLLNDILDRREAENARA